MHLEIRPFRRTDTTLPEAYGPEALQLQLMPAVFQQIGPFVPSHEETLIYIRKHHSLLKKITFKYKKVGGAISEFLKNNGAKLTVL